MLHDLAVFAGGLVGSMLDPILNFFPVVTGISAGRAHRSTTLIIAVVAVVIIIGLTATQSSPRFSWFVYRLIAGLVWACIAAFAMWMIDRLRAA